MGPKEPTALTGSIAHHQPVSFNVYTISGWQTQSGPWIDLQAKRYPSLSIADIKNKTVAQICSGIGYPIPAGANGSASISSLIAGGDSFQRSMIVAELNMYLGKVPAECIGSAELKTMAGGTFTPAYGPAWNQSEIKDFLYYNWLAH